MHFKNKMSFFIKNPFLMRCENGKIENKFNKWKSKNKNNFLYALLNNALYRVDKLKEIISFIWFSSIPNMYAQSCAFTNVT